MSNVLLNIRQPDYFTLTVTLPNGTSWVSEINAPTGTFMAERAQEGPFQSGPPSVLWQGGYNMM